MQQVSRVENQYTDEVKRGVIASYVVHGNQSEVARVANIPRKTVNEWCKSSWGLELISQIRHENGDEMISGFTNIIKRALKTTMDRLDTGDYVGLDSEGKTLYKPVSARDSIVIAGIATDKMRLLSNQATSITVTDSALTKISEQLQQFTRHKQEKDITPST